MVLIMIVLFLISVVIVADLRDVNGGCATFYFFGLLGFVSAGFIVALLFGYMDNNEWDYKVARVICSQCFPR